MSLDEFWDWFQITLEDLQSGMCFFEGLVPSISTDNFVDDLITLKERSENISFSASVWSNETPESVYTKNHDLSTYVDYFLNQKIIILSFDYEIALSNITLTNKLNFETIDDATRLEIICYREPILESNTIREAVFSAVEEFHYLKALFRGNKLFVGPDTLDYPTSQTEEHNLWFRMA